jgi:hypothetical protein
VLTNQKEWNVGGDDNSYKDLLRLGGETIDRNNMIIKEGND